MDFIWERSSGFDIGKGPGFDFGLNLEKNGMYISNTNTLHLETFHVFI